MSDLLKWRISRNVAIACPSSVQKSQFRGGLRKYDMDFIAPSLEVFQANMTCCRRKHEHQDYCDKETASWNSQNGRSG